MPAGIERRVVRALRRLARRRSCVSVAELAAEARLTPSDVHRALEVLEHKRLVVVSGDKVCYIGGVLDEQAHAIGRELRRVLDEARSRRSIVASVYEVERSPLRVVVIVRRDGVVFAVLPVTGREPAERLAGLARRLARLARRIAEQGCNEFCVDRITPRLVVPVLASDYGAPRLIEGVLFRPARGLLNLIIEPGAALSDPFVRVYECNRQARREESQYIE